MRNNKSTVKTLHITKTDRENLKDIFSNTNMIIELINDFIKGFYEMREQKEYHELFDLYKSTHNRDYEKQIKQMLNDYRLSKEDFLEYMQQHLKDLYPFYQRELRDIYVDFQEAVCWEKGLGFFKQRRYSKLPNRVRLKLSQVYNEEKYSVINLEDYSISVLDKIFHLDNESRELVDELLGNKTVASLFIYRCGKVTISLKDKKEYPVMNVETERNEVHE